MFLRFRALVWAGVKLRFVARRQWDHWDVGFFLDGLLGTLGREP